MSKPHNPETSHHILAPCFIKQYNLQTIVKQEDYLKPIWIQIIWNTNHWVKSVPMHTLESE